MKTLISLLTLFTAFNLLAGFNLEAASLNQAGPVTQTLSAPQNVHFLTLQEQYDALMAQIVALNQQILATEDIEIKHQLCLQREELERQALEIEEQM